MIFRLFCISIISIFFFFTPLYSSQDPPVEAEVYFQKGLENYMTGKYHSAVSEFIQAIKTDPTHGGAKVFLNKCNEKIAEEQKQKEKEIRAEEKKIKKEEKTREKEIKAQKEKVIKEKEKRIKQKEKTRKKEAKVQKEKLKKKKAGKTKSVEPKLSIAIGDLTGKNVSAMDASIVSDLLRTELVNTASFKVLDRTNMEQLLREQQFQQKGCTTQECAIQMGKILNVQRMITGTFSKILGRFFITVNFVNVETGEIVGAETVKCRDVDELPEASRELAARLSEKFGR